MERMVDISYIYPDVIEACHEELRRHFEPIILETLALPEVHVFTGLTLRLVRLTKATTLLCRAGLIEESKIMLRSATESIVNLLYIMYVGPEPGKKTQSDLAKQFIVYADVAYSKMLTTRPDQARNARKKRDGMTDTEFDAFMLEKKSLADTAMDSHDCTSLRWTKLDLVSMANKVRKNAPAFVHGDMADTAFSTFVGVNSATHGDALSLRSHYKEYGNAPLELVYQAENINADVVGSEACWAWKTIGEYYNQLDFVNKCFDKHLRDEMKKRYAAAEPSRIVRGK